MAAMLKVGGTTISYTSYQPGVPTRIGLSKKANFRISVRDGARDLARSSS